MTDFDPVDTAATAGAAIIGVVIVVLVMTQIGLLAPTLFGGDSVIEPVTGEFVDVPEANSLDDIEVSATTGTAATIDGDGHIESPAPATDGSLSLAATTQLDGDADLGAGYAIAGYNESEISLRYDDGDWVAEHNHDGTKTMATANADSPQDWTALVAVWDDANDELALWVDGSQDGQAQIGETVQRQVASDLEGDIEEKRLWDEALDSAAIDTYSTDPVAPQPETDHAVRLLFDEGEGSSTLAQYVDGDAELVGNADWTDGFGDGQDIERGVDFETENGELQALESGYLDGQPRAYVSYTGDGPFASVFATLTSTGGAALTLLVVGVLVMVASRVASAVNDF